MLVEALRVIIGHESAWRGREDDSRGLESDCRGREGACTVDAVRVIVEA